MDVKIEMKDGTILPSVRLYSEIDLGDTVLTSKVEIEDMLTFNDAVYFSNFCVQGMLIIDSIQEYKILNKNKEMN